MNLENERIYQLLMNALDCLELTEGNRKLAESYLDMSGEEDRALLSGAEHQDFTKIKCAAESCNYVDYLQKRKLLEEYGRYVRFAAAVGGATAENVISYYDATSYLAPEQAAALRAASAVSTQYRLNKVPIRHLYRAGKENPQVLLDALDLCWQEADNARLLLAAVYLFAVSTAESQAGAKKGQGLLKMLFSKKDGAGEERPGVLRALRIVEDDLQNSMRELLAQTSDEEAEILKNYIKESDPGEPIPERVLQVFNKKMSPNEYLMKLLTGAAFFSVGHSRKAFAFLRIAMLADMYEALAACVEMSPQEWASQYTELLERSLDKSLIKDYIKWCLRNVQRVGFVQGSLKRMVQQYPDDIKTLLPDLDTEEYGVLMEKIRSGNISLYKALNNGADPLYREKMIKELTEWCNNVGLRELKGYLAGEESLEALLPYVDEWREKQKNYYSGWTLCCSWTKIMKIPNTGEDQLFRRALVMEALLMHGDCFTRANITGVERETSNAYYQGLNLENMVDMLELFEMEKLPMHYCLSAIEGMYDCFYNDKDKIVCRDFCVEALVKQTREKDASVREEFVRESKEGSAVVRLLCVMVLDKLGEEYKDALLACAADSSLQVREILAAVCVERREWEPEVKALLCSKKSQERELAITVLKQWGAENYREELTKALESEKSRKIKTLLCEVLGVAGDAAPQGQDGAGLTPEQFAADILKGGRKRKVAWAYETPFPEVHKTDGTPAGEEILQAILVSYADMKTPGLCADAARLAESLVPSELAAFMSELFGRWIEAGAEAKKKWVLYAASIHGREKVTPVLYRQIQEWPANSRGAMAMEGVKALALSGSADGLILVDQLARKCKFRQVKTAAGEALSYAAEQLGISRDELEDRIVPNLGFDHKMEQIFDYGSRTFRVYLNPSLELEVFSEDGKKLKNLPAPGKRDDEGKAQEANSSFKTMKKQLKTVVENQKLRLEQAMSVERKWTVEKWQELFVKNPVMHQFAIGLIWGIYEENALKDTFRYMEDGSFNTVDQDEYELPQEGLIGLVHPIELDEEALAAWKEQLEDYEVTQPIEQLERTVYRVTEEEKGKKELERFGGKLLNGLSLSGKLQGMGWYRGCVIDGGGYYEFYRQDGNIFVELEFSGVFIGDENEEVTVYGASFYQTDDAHKGIYEAARAENKLKLEDVNPRYFSEIVYQLTKATVSSHEQLPYPKCRGNR